LMSTPIMLNDFLPLIMSLDSKYFSNMTRVMVIRNKP
jgi:hypothetical protein